MASLLSPDSRFYQSWASAADLVILNLLTIVASIPVVTAGAALAATARVTAEMAREEETYIVHSWWSYFRTNFKQATLVWVPATVLLLALWFEQRILQEAQQSLAVTVMLGLIVAGALLVSTLLAWYFPLITHFRNSVRNHAANALLLSVAHPLTSLLTMTLVAAPIVLVLFVPSTLNAVGVFMVAIGFAFISYLIALAQRKTLSHLLGRN